MLYRRACRASTVTRVHAALASGIGKPKIDLSQGYAEGQRNNECARRAGYCFAQGMTEEEALQECLKWNESNTPPLDARRSGGDSCKHRPTGSEKAGFTKPDRGSDPIVHTIYLRWRRPAVPSEMLIKKLLPASGIAFIGGQSGAGKTFVAVALGVALAAGTEFCGYSVRERIGVAYVVGEGAGMFAARVAAAKLALGVKETLPFAWADQVPDLQSPNGIAAFIERIAIRRAGDADTIRGATRGDFFGHGSSVFSDERRERQCGGKPNLSHHATHWRQRGSCDDPGASLWQGSQHRTRGASAWRAAADVVLSVTCDIDALSGRATNHSLAIAKARDAEQGRLRRLSSNKYDSGSTRTGSH